jgi:hypothetical protein
MKLQLRVAFRGEELAACLAIEGLAVDLSRHATSPFWLDWSARTFKSIAEIAPRVLRNAHLSRLEVSKREKSSVRFFEVLPRTLLKVSDEDFEVWERDFRNPLICRSPDGLTVKRVPTLTLSSGDLQVGEIAFPESGESCQVARIETLDILKQAGVTGFETRSVRSKLSDRLTILDPQQIVASSSEDLSFGAKLTDDGCKILDRPAILTLDAENSRAISTVALLPVSRFGCSGTIIVTKEVVETLEKLGINGLRFSPIIVVGEGVWDEAKTAWARFQACL